MPAGNASVPMEGAPDTGATVQSQLSPGRLSDRVSMQTEAFDGTLQVRLSSAAGQPDLDEVVLHWLGQAGFAIAFDKYRLLIDPYLSDTLAEKYGHTAFPHRRLMAPPVLPEALDRVDLVLCTHRHTDHMDPATLQALAHRFPALCFVVPRAVVDEAARRCGVGMERLIPVNAGERVTVLPGCTVSPIASAHETLDKDANGCYPWLGYIIDFGAVKLYHSGDCIPYRRLRHSLAMHRPDVALLPVNGRDAVRRQNGIPGNFTLDEAIALCRQSDIPAMVAHHFGLFDFNTIAPERIDACAQAHRNDLAIYRAQTQRAWRIKREPIRL